MLHRVVHALHKTERLVYGAIWTRATAGSASVAGAGYEANALLNPDPSEANLTVLQLLAKHWELTAIALSLIALLMLRILRMYFIRNSFRRVMPVLRKKDSLVNQVMTKLSSVLPGDYHQSIDAHLLNIDSDPAEALFFHSASEMKYFKSIEAAGISAGIMNYRAFHGAIWGDSEEAKIIRNTAHLRRNPGCIKFLRFPKEDSAQSPPVFIGYTHVLPLTEDGLREYREGRVKDNGFPAKYICTPDMEPQGLLLFAFANDHVELDVMDPKKKKAYKNHYFISLVKMLHQHMREQLLLVKGNKGIPVLLQNDRATLLAWSKRIFGMKDTGRKTGDNEVLLQAITKLDR